MSFYIVNIFHEHAASFCTAALEKGFEVCAVGIPSMNAFGEEEEMVWMKFGRNANIVYECFEKFIQEKAFDIEKKILYFPFQEERHLTFLKKLDEWDVQVYVVSDESQAVQERIDHFIVISEDEEQFVQEFLY